MPLVNTAPRLHPITMVGIAPASPKVFCEQVACQTELQLQPITGQ
jgi:hypothetical protein